MTGSSNLTAGSIYQLVLEVRPTMGTWFSIADTATRLGLAVLTFYWLLLTEPVSLLRFAYGWNTLWYGHLLGVPLTLYLPLLPFALSLAEVAKRLCESLPGAGTDWKMQGPGRVFFMRPDSLAASLLWDSYLAVSVFSSSFLQYRNDPDGLMHTWYDEICVKEYWYGLLDAARARRPMQLARWDGEAAHDVGLGVAHGQADLVCKISDSYLGIGDRILCRGKARGGDFDTLGDVHALLAADPEYAGRSATVCELIAPTARLKLSSDGFGNVHSLDIITMRTKADGVKVLTVLLWTDCTGWSSHSCEAGYVCDVDSETVVAPAAWYGPYFAQQTSSLLGTCLPGLREACEKAIAAHESSELPWLTTVGWDAMLTDNGVYFFEGNVAAYRTPRRMFLDWRLTVRFLREWSPRARGWF